MKGKTLKEFFDTLSWGEEMEFSYMGKGYFIQGINHGEKEKEIQLFQCNVPDSTIYSYRARSFEECVINLQETKLFDGKTIYEIEREITVVYG